MEEVQQEVEQQETRPIPVRLEKEIECDELADPVAEYMEARKEHGLGSSALAAMKVGTSKISVHSRTSTVLCAIDYDSDDEVYAAAKAADEDLEAEYDSDDQLVIKKREIGAIPALDHDQIEYEDFKKEFYKPCPTIQSKTKEQITQTRESSGIRVGGFNPPAPIESFFQCGFDIPLLSVINKQKYEVPTPVQMQTLPVALSGRDVVGIAKTGSGKTAAYILPLCVHVIAAPTLKRGEGPIAVTLSPTRELSEQIHKQARIFAKPYELTVVACFGGLSKYEQVKALKSGSDVVVATPGRLIDLIKAKACSMRHCTFVVLDEADRMFDMGFEGQVRSIIGQIRPDRQTLLFSATMPPKVERLARDILTNPIKISVGRAGAVNEDIKQIVEVVASDMMKYLWLSNNLPTLVDAGEVLIFANQKSKVDEITSKLKEAGFRAEGIHGDMDQQSRMQILQDFRNEVHHVLVATDVAARGLDIKNLHTVINFDCSKNAEGHVHRVGRTGRAGDKDGVAYTLLTPKETKQAVFLVSSLTAAGQEVTEALNNVAMKDKRYGTKGRKGRNQVGGAGLGFNQMKVDHSQTSISTFTPAPIPRALKTDLSSSSEKLNEPYRSTGAEGGEFDEDTMVIAPKRSTQRVLPPPPVPVTEQPLYTTPRPPLMSNRTRLISQSDANSNEALNKARAVAQELSARFGSKSTKPGTG
eukprot:g6503.t1